MTMHLTEIMNSNWRFLRVWNRSWNLTKTSLLYRQQRVNERRRSFRQRLCLMQKGAGTVEQLPTVNQTCNWAQCWIGDSAASFECVYIFNFRGALGCHLQISLYWSQITVWLISSAAGENQFRNVLKSQTKITENVCIAIFQASVNTQSLVLFISWISFYLKASPWSTWGLTLFEVQCVSNCESFKDLTSGWMTWTCADMVAVVYMTPSLKDPYLIVMTFQPRTLQQKPHSKYTNVV